MLQGFWPLLTTTQWSKVTLPLVHAIAAKQRQDAVRLVSYAYSSIQPDRLASLTGTNPQEALQRIVQSPSLHALTQTRRILPLHCDCPVGFLSVCLIQCCACAVAQSEGWQMNGDVIMASLFWLEDLHHALHLDDMLSMFHILWSLVIFALWLLWVYTVSTLWLTCCLSVGEAQGAT